MKREHRITLFLIMVVAAIVAMIPRSASAQINCCSYKIQNSWTTCNVTICAKTPTGWVCNTVGQGLHTINLAPNCPITGFEIVDFSGARVPITPVRNWCFQYVQIGSGCKATVCYQLDAAGCPVINIDPLGACVCP